MIFGIDQHCRYGSEHDLKHQPAMWLQEQNNATQTSEVYGLRVFVCEKYIFGIDDGHAKI